MKRMLFNATHPEETRVAIVDGQKLIDIDIETAGREARKSNIYTGVITRIEPSLEACFVNYGEERHGFLPFKEISRIYFKEGTDVRNATIRDAIHEGQEVVVQVEKEERGNKGAALTTFVSLAGRYLVLMPNNPRGGGVSRRIEGEERQELRESMSHLKLPSGMSTIARTAGIGRTTEELQWDLNYLLKLWEAVSGAATAQYELVKKVNGKDVKMFVTTPEVNGVALSRANPAPYLIVEESNLVVRAIRDYFQSEIGEILVDTDEIYEQARQFMQHVMPDMVGRVKRYQEDVPLFTRFQIEHQIESAYSRTVALPSGGAIVIDHTEALVAVDVNSARATRGSDIEETAFRTNCEAADEVARQMRLRDLGGLIVIDFIDMSDAKNQRAVEQRLKDALHYDRARVQMAKISRFGLMEVSRQRLRPALSEGNHITCPRCNGVGVIRDTESCALQVLRILQEEAMKEGTGALHAQVPVDVATFLLNEKRTDVMMLEARHRVPVVLIPNISLETPHYHIERIRQDDDRLDETVLSFNRAEELETVSTDPYALKQTEETPTRSKQVPIIKNVLPTEPAPVHPVVEEKTAKPANDVKAPSLLSRILSFFIGEKKEPVEPEKKEKARDPRRKDRSNNRRRRNTRRTEEETTPTTTEVAEKPQKEERRRNRRQEKLVVETPKEATKTVATPARVEAAPLEEEKASKPSRRRTRRPRQDKDNEKKVVTPVETDNVVAEEKTPSTVLETPASTTPVVVTEEKVAPSKIETNVDVEKTEVTQPEVAAEAPAEEENAEGKRRRRPRRRRSRNTAEDEVSTSSQPTEVVAQTTSEPVNAPEVKAQESVEVVQPVEQTPVADKEVLVQIETKSEVKPVVDPVVEPIVEPVAEPMVETVVETLIAPVAQEQSDTPVADIADHLDENLKKAGLKQVQTKAKFIKPLVVVAPTYEGRTIASDVDAQDEGTLEQVHTRDDLIKPVEVIPPTYAGRTMVSLSEDNADEPLVQVHTQSLN